MIPDKEERVTFSLGDLSLEGLLSRGRATRGVVISHPHPLYGGEMRNHVVGIIQEVFAGKGWTTLRFNFRGVGRSQGEYDEGVGRAGGRSRGGPLPAGSGDQGNFSGRLFLRGLGERPGGPGYAGGGRIHPGGPPQTMMDFSFLKDDAKTRLVIVGEWDTFGPVGEIHEDLRRNESPAAGENHIGGRSFFQRVDGGPEAGAGINP